MRRTVETNKQENKSIKLFAADQGIIAQSQFQVFMTQIQLHLRKEKIGMECGEV